MLLKDDLSRFNLGGDGGGDYFYPHFLYSNHAYLKDGCKVTGILLCLPSRSLFMKPLCVMSFFIKQIFSLTGGSVGQVDISSSHVDPKTTLLSPFILLCM